MKKRFHLPKQSWLLPGFLAVMVWGFAVSASAEPIIRMVSFKAAGAAQQKEVHKTAVEANKLYAAAKGCQWVKFWSNPSTFEEGSVSLWDSPADVDAFEKSDAYKAVRKKLNPLTKGKISVKVEQVYAPK